MPPCHQQGEQYIQKHTSASISRCFFFLAIFANSFFSWSQMKTLAGWVEASNSMLKWPRRHWGIIFFTSSSIPISVPSTRIFVSRFQTCKAQAVSPEHSKRSLNSSPLIRCRSAPLFLAPLFRNPPPPQYLQSICCAVQPIAGCRPGSYCTGKRILCIFQRSKVFC